MGGAEDLRHPALECRAAHVPPSVQLGSWRSGKPWPQPPHATTLLPPLSPSHSSVEQVRRSSFFHKSELTNASSSGLNRLKTDPEATRINFLLARLNATVSRRGSSRNSPDSSR